MKILKKAILSFLSVLVVLTLLLFDTVDRTPYQETTYYQKYQEIIRNWSEKKAVLEKNNTSDSLWASWAKVSITPSFPTPMSGYSRRKAEFFENIADSIWVRAFVVRNGQKKIAIVTADLLIMPPSVLESLKEKLPKIGFSVENIHFSATHTHSSLGGWGDTFAGYMIGGKYNPEVVELISSAIVQALEKAEKTLEKAKIGYGQNEARELIENRLIEKGKVDPYFRWLVFEKESGKKAILCTFAAHATCYGSDWHKLSGDYPAVLVKELEKTNDFAAYMAGAVGSQSCSHGDLKSAERIDFIAKNLAQKYQPDSTVFEKTAILQSFRLPLPLREPQFRVHQNIRVRPFLFDYLVGNLPTDLSFLQIGKTVLVGTPCDFSGELMEKIQSKNQNIILTSFNGGYIGYITADEWYDLEAYETLSMNWFGAQNGAYLTEYINTVLEKID